MLDLLATSLCLLSGVGCGEEDLAGPAGTGPKAAPNSVVVSDSQCATVQFRITSATEVQATFPSRAACATGLVLIPGPAASWAQHPDRPCRPGRLADR